MSFAFSDLDLSNVSQSSRLGVGVHKVEITDVNWDAQTGALSLDMSGSGGTLTDTLRLYSDNEVGKRISEQRLKQYLVATDHHNPDRPDDIGWFKGKRVTIRVEPGKSFRRDDGSTGQYKNITGVFAPDADVPAPAPAPAPASDPFTAAPSSQNFDDAIPF
jgi:hypothetical protein